MRPAVFAAGFGLVSALPVWGGSLATIRVSEVGNAVHRVELGDEVLSHSYYVQKGVSNSTNLLESAK